MKIGLIFTVYNALDLAALDPWCEFRAKSKDVDLSIAATTALFKEYAELGASYENQFTERLLCSYSKEGKIDALFIERTPILDYKNRSISWSYLKDEDVDFVWQLDADEFYTVKEIEDTCNWLKNNNLYDFYKVNFKNYIGNIEDKTYVLDFKPLRIVNNRMKGGIKDFYWDNDIVFNDGTKTPFCAGKEIPAKICNPKHLSWVGDKEFLIKKIKYQKKAIGTCSYSWDEEKDCLIFNEEYYSRSGIQKPTVYSERHLDH